MLPRIGLLGCGMIGAWHARIVAENAGATLVAVCDLDGARAAGIGARHGVTAHDDPERFLTESRLDGVIIATPEDAHLDNLALAARYGIAMLVEKPVGRSVAEIDAMIALTETAHVPVMAGHVERFEAGSVQLKAALEEGLCGDVVSILARRQFSPGDAPRFAGRSSTLRVLGVHDFDLVAWVHPAPVAEVYAAAGRGPLFARTGLDDHVVTVIRFADGAIASVESAWTLPPGYAAFARPASWNPAGNNRLDVFGSKGMVSNDMSLRSQQLIAFDGDGFRAAGLKHQPVLHGRVEGALKIQFEHFLSVVRKTSAPLVGLRDARRAVAITVAAETSLVSGLPVACED